MNDILILDKMFKAILYQDPIKVFFIYLLDLAVVLVRLKLFKYLIFQINKQGKD